MKPRCEVRDSLSEPSSREPSCQQVHQICTAKRLTRPVGAPRQSAPPLAPRASKARMRPVRAPLLGELRTSPRGLTSRFWHFGRRKPRGEVWDQSFGSFGGFWGFKGLSSTTAQVLTGTRHLNRKTPPQPGGSALSFSTTASTQVFRASMVLGGWGVSWGGWGGVVGVVWFRWGGWGGCGEGVSGIPFSSVQSTTSSVHVMHGSAIVYIYIYRYINTAMTPTNLFPHLPECLRIPRIRLEFLRVTLGISASYPPGVLQGTPGCSANHPEELHCRLDALMVHGPLVKVGSMSRASGLA